VPPFAGDVSERACWISAGAACVELAGRTRITVVADGLVTNADALAASRGDGGDGAPCDTARLLGAAYLRWGGALARHVVGQFAAAIIDHDDRSVTLVQDSLGIRQLFWATTNGGFQFASRLADLVALVRPADLDREYFADTLACAMPCTERTPWRGIRRLRYGASATWRGGRCALSMPWDPTHARELPPLRDDEYEDALRERLAAAVAPMVGARETVWCHLSGGLDSTTVLMTARALGHRVEPITFVDPARADLGDTEIARGVAATLDVPWHTIDASGTRPFSAVPRDPRGEPGAETHAARQAEFHALLRAHGVDAVLTGMGGDVTFASPDCPPHHLADALCRFQPLRLWRLLAEHRRADPQRRSLLHWLVNGALRPATRHALRRRIGKTGAAQPLPSWLNEAFVRDHDLRRRARAQDTPRHPDTGRHALWEEVYLQAADLTPAAGAGSPAEARHPLLDRRLLELMFTIPFEQRQRPDVDRWLQRRALRDVLPPAVAKRRGKGTGQRPFDEGLRTGRAWIELLTDRPRLVEAGFVDAHRWAAEVDRARFGLYESLPHFAMAACIECWLRASA
jgi:asparagine synthase (glutamine-hydrolysing)